MNKKLFKKYEVVCLALSCLGSVLMWYIYKWGSKGVVSAMVSTVNNSPWENTKPLVLVYIFLGIIELGVARPPLRQFVVAKFVGVYIVLLMFIAISSIIDSADNLFIKIVGMCVTMLLAYVVSYKITTSNNSAGQFFMTACFMLLLLVVMIVSFTVFPPHGKLFADADTGLYGIVPDYIDVGAIVLDKIYY